MDGALNGYTERSIYLVEGRHGGQPSRSATNQKAALDEALDRGGTPNQFCIHAVTAIIATSRHLNDWSDHPTLSRFHGSKVKHICTNSLLQKSTWFRNLDLRFCLK